MTFVPYYLSVVFESLTLVLVVEGILPKFWRLLTLYQTGNDRWQYIHCCLCVKRVWCSLMKFRMAHIKSKQGQNGSNMHFPLRAKECLLLNCIWLFVTPWTVAPGYSVYEVLQARILEWVTIPSSRGSSQPRFPGIEAGSPALQADYLLSEPIRA